MKKPLGRLVMCVLIVAVVLMGNRLETVFAQTNPAQAPTQTQASKPGQAPNTAGTTQRSAASNTTKAGTNSQTPAKPAAARATANSANTPSGAGLIAPPGWTPPAQSQAPAPTGQKTAAMPAKKTSSAASTSATKQKDKTGNADSH
jgi:cytoskeletal protein RodZ